MSPDRSDTTPAARAHSETGAVVASVSDAAAVHAVERHHAELAGALTAHVEALLNAVGGVADPGVAAVEPSRGRLVGFCTAELLPHAAAEEGSLYPAAAAYERARLLVEAMVAEHRVLEGLVEEIRTAEGPVRAAAAGNALRVLFEVHLTKENDLILPLVAADPNVSVKEILAGMHELLGHQGHDGHEGHDAEVPASGGG
ncbi:MAG: hemerythrin domain-containing protein [Mycobacteriaceae bacterium]